ncbi:DUF1127 domain-containing protein [Magnetovibrio sp.]|uniref:DUF1127 domain-containing protein n=1 Tax=Magnetovibrio sp. TaxID=2024836 RepID=UPI002F92E852
MTHNALHACCNDVHAHAPAHVDGLTHSVPFQDRVVRTLILFAEWCKRAYALHMQRRSLRSLNDRQLRDIGLKRTEALREAARPFWDQP